MAKTNFVQIHTIFLDLKLKVNYTDNSNNEKQYGKEIFYAKIKKIEIEEKLPHCRDIH